MTILFILKPSRGTFLLELKWPVVLLTTGWTFSQLQLSLYHMKCNSFQIVECAALHKCTGDTVSQNITCPHDKRRAGFFTKHNCVAPVSRKSALGSPCSVPTHTQCWVRAALEEKLRSIRHPQPQAILHLGGLIWQTVAWLSTCLLYRQIILLSYLSQIQSPTTQTDFWAP